MWPLPIPGTICPSYMLTLDEQVSTRGRANALRLVMSGEITGGNALDNPILHDALDLCLQCKACKTECPSNVDMAKLKEATERIGYPVMLKSTAGGGGIGMRLCWNQSELEESFAIVQRLGAANFHS